MIVLTAVLPLVSILLGAGITYWLNVRTRKQTAVDDLFTNAIAALALANVAQNYVGYAPRWSEATDEEYQQFLNELRRNGLVNAIQKIQLAREALAVVIPYRPDLDHYLRDPSQDVVARHAPELIAELRRGPDSMSNQRA